MQINSNSVILQEYLVSLQNKQTSIAGSFENSYEFYQSNKSESQTSKDILLEQLSQISNNDNFNEKISQVAQNMDEDNLKLFAFVLNESPNMNRYSDVILGDKNIDKVNGQKSVQITKKFVFNTNEEALDFINDTLKHLETSIKNNFAWERDYEEGKSKEFYNTFENIRTNYIKTIDENNAILGIMTHYAKPISLEEAQRQKDQEQFDLAMKRDGLNPKNNLDVATFKFMQEGYSNSEAIERTQAYKSAGLILDTFFEEKFGTIVYNLSFMENSPEYKKALEASFEKMDTETIKGVLKTISSSGVFSISMEDMMKIMPRDEKGLGSKEVMRRLNEYWDNRYGSTEKMMEMFDKVLRQNEINQKFSTDDFSYIEAGLNILIETYNFDNAPISSLTKKGKRFF
jgi:hypothetical protein